MPTWPGPSGIQSLTDVAVTEDDRPRLTVDLAALARNLRALRSRRPTARAMPVIKANAYGLGAVPVAKALAGAGAAGFFVAYPQEAEELRDAGIDRVIYCLNARGGSGTYTDLVRPVLSTRPELDRWRGGPCAVQVEIGMNRLGIRPDELDLIPVRRDVTLVIAHMSDAGEPASPRNDQQRKRFAGLARRLTGMFPDAALSLSATGGLMLDGQVAETVIRPGIGLFGGRAGVPPALEAVARLDARVLSVHDVPAGDHVGYDGRWTAARPSRLATLAIGYADGVPRSLGNRGSVSLGGACAPIVGAVSMDLLTVDVTGLPPVEPGDRAEIFGPHLPLDEVAATSGTIGYELLTRVGARVVRVYRDASSVR